MSDPQLRAKVVLAELEAMGLSIADLVAVASTGTRADHTPTLAEYVEVVAQRYKARTLRTYGSYWRFALTLIGDKALNEVTTDDLAKVLVAVRDRAMANRAGSDVKRPGFRDCSGYWVTGWRAGVL